MAEESRCAMQRQCCIPVRLCGVAAALLPALGLAAAAVAGDIQIENRTPHVFVFHLRSHDDPLLSPPHSLPAGQRERITTTEAQVIRYYDGQQWVSYQLPPGRLYAAQPGSPGMTALIDAGPIPPPAAGPPPAAAPSTIVENASSRPLVYDVRPARGDEAPQAETVPPGQVRRYTATGRLVVHLSDPRGPTTWVLNRGRRYRYVLDAHGNGDLQLDRPDQPDRPPLRDIAVLAVADETYRRAFPEWKERTAEIIAAASADFDDAFAIRFRLVGCRQWNYRAVPRGSASDVTDKLLAIRPPDAELVIGFVAVAQEAAGEPESTSQIGWSPCFGRHLYVVDYDRRQLPGTTLIMLRTLARLFGAFYVMDPASLMRPLAQAVPLDYEFGEAASQVIRLSRDFDLEQGVSSLPAESAWKIRELYKKFHHPHDPPTADPITLGRRTERLYRSLGLPSGGPPRSPIPAGKPRATPTT